MRTGETATAASLRTGPADHSLLVEPLTEREVEILDYLPTRMRNAEVAAALFISVNTLKTHLRHIYDKLSVADRDAAVAAAVEMGLLQPI